MKAYKINNFNSIQFNFDEMCAKKVLRLRMIYFNVKDFYSKEILILQFHVNVLCLECQFNLLKTRSYI